MAHRKTLTEAQVALLRWISDGCPEGVVTGVGYRVSAAALRGRGLVTTSGRGETWSAAITDAGRAYLERADGSNPPVPRQANQSVTERLVADVVAAGGSLVLARTGGEPGDIDYENRARLAERFGKVPPGKRLEVTRLSWDEVRIDLVDVLEGGAAIERRPVEVPDQVGRYHPVVRAFRDDTDRYEISRAALPRVLRILQGLVTEAEQRGYAVRLAGGTLDTYYSKQWSGSREGHLVLATGDFESPIRITEEGVPSRLAWLRKSTTYEWEGGRSRRIQKTRADYEARATGRLTFELLANYSWHREQRWSDRKAWTVEDKLPDLFVEFEARIANAARQRQEAERKAIERQSAWEAALERAHTRYHEHLRAESLSQQIAQWRKAGQIRSYCDAMETHHGDDADTAEWIGWARAYADNIDPLTKAPRGPSLPDEVSGQDLQPFLDGWSAYGPDPRYGRRR